MIPAFHEQLSLNPIIVPPMRVRIIPMIMFLVSFSLRKIGARIATQSGDVLTSTTELVMVVYSRDVIQVAK